MTQHHHHQCRYQSTWTINNSIQHQPASTIYIDIDIDIYIGHRNRHRHRHRHQHRPSASASTSTSAIDIGHRHQHRHRPLTSASAIGIGIGVGSIFEVGTGSDHYRWALPRASCHGPIQNYCCFRTNSHRRS